MTTSVRTAVLTDVGLSGVLATPSDGGHGAVVLLAGGGPRPAGFRGGERGRQRCGDSRYRLPVGGPGGDLDHATIAAGGPLRLSDAFAALPDGEALEQISIPVERIAGAVLLISASDDGMWNSTAYSDVAADRFRRAGHAYTWEHVVLDGAGHSIAGPPGAPFTTAARATAWQRTVGFLQEHLR